MPWSLTRIWPNQPLELRDGKGRVIASTTSDGEGRFAFTGVRQGAYVLGSPETAAVGVLDSLIVTDSNATCARPIYAYVDEQGWPCRTWVTRMPPVDLQPLEPEGRHNDRLVAPRDTGGDDCAATAAPVPASKYAHIRVNDDGRIIVVTQGCQRLTFEDVPRSHGTFPYSTASHAVVAPDHSAAAWLALFKECETCSATDVLPLELMVLSDGRATRITGAHGDPIWFWMFQNGGRQVAFMEGTRSDYQRTHYELWNVATGTRVSDYTPKWDENGRPIGLKPPKWVRDVDATHERR